MHKEERKIHLYMQCLLEHANRKKKPFEKERLMYTYVHMCICICIL